MAYVGKQPLPANLLIDQGQFGICEGAGIAHQLEFEALDVGLQVKLASLFIYRGSKVREGNWDEGTNPVYGYQTLMEDGVCLEEDYPLSLLTDVHNIPAPSAEAMDKAKQFKIAGVTPLELTTDALDQALENGKVVNIGTLVFDNFVQAPEEGFIDLPQGTIDGGHDYVVFAKDDELTHQFPSGKTVTGFYYIQNSWLRQHVLKVAKEFLAFHLDVGAPVLEGAWIVNTGWKQEVVPPAPQPDPIPAKLYHVQVGAFANPDNAAVLVNELKDKGFDAFIKYE